MKYQRYTASLCCKDIGINNLEFVVKSYFPLIYNVKTCLRQVHDLYSIHMCVFRFEYGEMNITKLNQRIDDIEDEIYREKLKIKKCADDLGETFDDMLTNY